MKIRQKRLLKKLISISLTLITIASLTIPMCISSSAAENITDFLGGDGSSENPYIIVNKNHFNNIRKYADDKAYFSILSNIKFTYLDFEEGGQFYNAFPSMDYFNGTLSGNGYTISGLKLSKGLFGENSGLIEDINFENVSSTIFGICGENNGTISNCNFSVEVSGELETVAGITSINNGEITNCHITVDVNSGVDVSGITLSNYGSITYCSVDGKVQTYYTGLDLNNISAAGISCKNRGVVAYCVNNATINNEIRDECFSSGIAAVNYGLISDCYNTGVITGDGNSLYGFFLYAAGIASKNEGTVYNCYNVGDVSRKNSPILSSEEFLENKTALNCYYLGNYIGNKYTACTDEEMQKEETFKGFDFGGVWKIDTASEYKYPQLITTDAIVESIELIDTETTCFSTKIGLYPDLSSLSIKVNYSDGNQRIMIVAPIMLDNFDVDIIGEVTTHLYFGGKITDETVSINILDREIIYISVTKRPESIYLGGAPLTDGEITVYFDNNTSEVVPLSDAEICYDTENAGTVPVTVKYRGFETQFDIIVKEVLVTEMSVTPPDKILYCKGQRLNLLNGKVSFKLGSESYLRNVNLADYMIFGYDPYQIGIQKISVNYLGATDEFIVRVLDMYLGDVNGDDRINVVDATGIQKYIVNLNLLSNERIFVADVNGDGAINVADATLIQKYVVGFVDSLG